MDFPRDASEFICSLKEEYKLRSLGTHLLVPQAELHRIKQECEGADEFLAEIYEYLERSGRKPTWNAIAIALEKVGNIQLAEEIRRKHGNPVKSSLNWRRENGEEYIGLGKPLTINHHISQKFLKLVDRYIALLQGLKEAIFRPTNDPQMLIDNLQFILKNKCGWEPIQGESLKDVFDRLNDRLACHNHKIFKMVLKFCFPEEEDLSRELKGFQEDHESFKESTEIQELKKLMSDCAASNEGRRVEVKVGRI